MKIGIIGAGSVGRALGRRFQEAGHEVRYGVRRPEADEYRELGALTVADAVLDTEVVVLATPWPSTQAALESAGDLTGKVIVDATNPIAADFTGLAQVEAGSAGLQVAQWCPGAHVVKAFNTVGYKIMVDPHFEEGPATMLVAGDDADAKAIVMRLSAETGFSPIDAGGLAMSHWLESFAWLWISLAMKHGRDIAFRLMLR